MYSYCFDETTGGILLNSTPSSFSKEPRPVYASELNMLGFDKYWNYDNQDDIPYMWAESVNYIYRGKNVAKLKGGNLFTAPEIIISVDENGDQIMPEPNGEKLRPIDIESMVEKNRDILGIIEATTVKDIVKVYEKHKNKLDVFHVAFSGGKDSEVLLDLVIKALPTKSFIVIFGDTDMEFPDTYEAVEVAKKYCEKKGVPFYIASSHFKPEESWKLFGPPARVLRWCCSVHKSAPQTLKLREILEKKDFVGLDFVGVRAYESDTRSEYKKENLGKKQKGQWSHNSILDWTSAEVWLYIFANNLFINKAYKKGHTRAGCLLCPMGGFRGDYMQLTSYPKEVNKFIDLIKSMNSTYKDDEKSLNQYLSNGGWNARKNGRDLILGEQHYKDEIKDNKIIITVENPKSDYREWIKTLGKIQFEYEIKETKNGYKVIVDSKFAKIYPLEVKKFKNVFHKSAYCLACRVCESNCPFGNISFENGLKITDCIHCGKCHEIECGCLAYHSLRVSTEGGVMAKNVSINSFITHAPKEEWIKDFFEKRDDFWENNTLGPNQVPIFKRFLRDSGLIGKDNKVTKLFEIFSNYAWDSESLWGVILANLAYNPQIAWYIKNMDLGVIYDRGHLADMIMAEGISEGDSTSVLNAYKRFSKLPLSTVLNFGYITEKSRAIKSLCRTKCNISDNRVILYSLYKFSEKCNNYKEFHLSWLMDDTADRDGISPTRIFGLDYEEMKAKLLGLSDRYPDFIGSAFTNDLERISLYDKTSEDVLELFRQ